MFKIRNFWLHLHEPRTRIAVPKNSQFLSARIVCNDTGRIALSFQCPVEKDDTEIRVFEVVTIYPMNSNDAMMYLGHVQGQHIYEILAKGENPDE